MGFDGLFVVDPMGRSGLAIMWKSDATLEVYNFSQRHINVIMKNEDGNPIWKFIGFYGHSDCARRSESWALLQQLKTLRPLPWLCAGDFNEILDNTNKEEANIRRESQINGFRIALEDCQLCDLGYTGSRFTWSNKRTDGSFTKERLDRAVANMEWFSRFHFVTVRTMVARTSDHCPIQISCYEDALKTQHCQLDLWPGMLEYYSGSIGDSKWSFEGTSYPRCPKLALFLPTRSYTVELGGNLAMLKNSWGRRLKNWRSSKKGKGMRMVLRLKNYKMI